MFRTQHASQSPKIEVAEAPPDDAPVNAVGPKIDDNWRRWIAENLMIESSHQDILNVLASHGIAAEEARHEIELAVRSPYFKASERLRNRLRKRDWVLSCYRKMNRLHPRAGEIERRHKLPRAEFLNEYYSTNRPVIITGMMDDWPAMKQWTLSYFATKFGEREIEVQTGRASDANYEIERGKHLSKMKMSEFLDRLRTTAATNDFYVTANNTSGNKAALSELWDDIVQIPEYLDSRDGSCFGGFFWMGPPGTVTPFHHDLTNNLMAQVMGRKRVLVAPSWDIPLMLNHFHVYSEVDGRVTPPSPQPGRHQPQILECILCPGEILFLPIGCMHYVEGLDITVTMSFTNFVHDNEFISFYTTYHEV